MQHLCKAIGPPKGVTSKCITSRDLDQSCSLCVIAGEVAETKLAPQNDNS